MTKVFLPNLVGYSKTMAQTPDNRIKRLLPLLETNIYIITGIYLF